MWAGKHADGAAGGRRRLWIIVWGVGVGWPEEVTSKSRDLGVVIVTGEVVKNVGR